MPMLFVASHEFPPKHGGIATFTVEVVRALHGAGEPIHLLVPRNSDLPASFIRDPQVELEIEKLPIAATHGIKATWGMAKALKFHEAALQDSGLLITEPGPIRALYLAVRLLNLKTPRFRVVVHGSELMRGLRSPMWSRPIHFALEKAEAIATVSHHNAAILIEKYKVPERRIVILPLAPKEELVRGIGAPERVCASEKVRLRLITVARLHPRKGQDHVLKALQELPDDLLRRIEYHIVGEGRSRRYKKRLRALARNCGAPVVFAGALDDRELIEAYEQADIFILTSRQHRSSVEGFGLVYIEANCFGLPVIGSRTGGTADAIIDGQTGLLLEDDASASIAAAIKRLVEDADLREKLAQTGQAKAKERSWHTVAEKLTRDGLR